MLTLARDGFYSPLWSDKIGNEWRRNAAKVWQVPDNVLETAWAEMAREFPDANVDRWPDPALQATTDLPRHSDPKDWHVILTGQHAHQAHPDDPISIVTWNLKDFKRSELRKLGLGLTDPDRLLCEWWDQNPGGVQKALQTVINDLVRTGRRRPEPHDSLLKRDRLFKLAKKCHA